MCGIGGIVASEGIEIPDGALDAMTRRLQHRGPDDTGVYRGSAADTQIRLCATRLAIRDLTSRGHQPMAGARTGCVVVFNGELYNADELRRGLEPYRKFASSSDTEVALAAYELWGKDACRQFRGMFALAIWDPRDASLLLARDPLGVKPLYYQASSSRLVFASEVRALLAGVARPPHLDVRSLDGYLATGTVQEPGTIIEGLRMLSTGSSLRWRAGKIAVESFWSIDDYFDDPLSISAKEAGERVRTELEGAVRRQLVSDAPVGVFLSGGIDSSALVGLSATVDRPPTTVSVVFEEQDYSEAPYITAVSERWGTDHREVSLGAEDFLERLPAAIAAMDQPTFDGVNTYVVSQLAKEAGLTVALSGLGGDELFAGYELFHSVPNLEKLRRVLPRVPKPLALRLAKARFGAGDRSRKLSRWLSGEVPSAYVLQREVIEPALRARFFGKDRCSEEDDAEAIALDANGVSRLELTRYMRNVLLRDADVMSMAHGLEVRVPLLDQALVELVTRLPAKHKVVSGREKPLLVDAVRDLLPPSILDRPKMGFTLPFEAWLRGRLRDEVRDVLLDPGVGGQIGAALAPDATREIWHRFERGETSWSRPWALYVAKVWGERHL
ncbi:MAG: asparagine synthase (glutamine-hydrolyzing) [Actinomycetota bacterium]|nr:asparagine synthase (glutamine-hydrolyzing) [Actinomycetota bacterium]